jgi:hypothetical protein
VNGWPLTSSSQCGCCAPVHDLLPSAEKARRHLARTTPSLSGFVVLLGVRGQTPGLAHHTVLFPADYDAEFDAIFGPRPRPVPDPTLYVAVGKDAAVAPPEHEAWFVLVNAPRQGAGGRVPHGQGLGGLPPTPQNRWNGTPRPQRATPTASSTCSPPVAWT